MGHAAPHGLDTRETNPVVLRKMAAHHKRQQAKRLFEARHGGAGAGQSRRRQERLERSIDDFGRSIEDLAPFLAVANDSLAAAAHANTADAWQTHGSGASSARGRRRRSRPALKERPGFDNGVTTGAQSVHTKSGLRTRRRAPESPHRGLLPSSARTRVQALPALHTTQALEEDIDSMDEDELREACEHWGFQPVSCVVTEEAMRSQLREHYSAGSGLTAMRGCYEDDFGEEEEEERGKEGRAGE